MIMEKVIKNIVFWGEDAFSNVVLTSLIQAGYNVKMVVTPLYDNLIYKRLEMTCTRNGIEFIREKPINSEKVYEKVKACEPDLCVICHFERLIKEPILSLPKYGFINVQPSLLPYYRGMAPQHWPIINGEKESGITCHYVDEGTDTGNIIVQRIVPLTDDMYVSDLQKVWLKEYSSLVVEAIECIKAEKPTRKQSHMSGSYYGKLKEEQCVINTAGSVKDAYNLVRGVSLPYYGARCNNTIIYRAHIASEDEIIDKKNTIAFYDGILVLDQYKEITTRVYEI